MRRHIVTTAVIAAVLGLTVAHTPAFNVSGRRWAVNPVQFYINPSNADVSQTAATSAILTSASAWSTQSIADVSFYYMGSTNSTTLAANGRNEVFFRPDGGSGAIATTYWWTDGSNRLIDADIVFYDGSYTFFTGTSGCSGGYYLEDVATHEFGHALGISHSDVPSATMVSGTGECNMEKRSLDIDDIDAVETLYPPAGKATPPAPEPPPPSDPEPPPPPPAPESAPLAVASPTPGNGATDVQAGSLSWAPATGATSYVVYFGKSSAPPKLATVANTSVSMPRLDAGATYYWRVVSVNGAGTASSDTWYFKTRAKKGGGRK